VSQHTKELRVWMINGDNIHLQ